MVPARDGRRELIQVRQVAASERRRAIRAAALADRYTARSAVVPQAASEPLARLAELHRRTAGRHSASAAIHQLHASRIEAWLTESAAGVRPPAFVATVAAALRTSSALATLRGQCRAALAVAASDPIARTAYDLETVFGEGPVAEAASGSPVTVAGEALRSRWPLYGPALAALGVAAVSATPLGLPAAVLGTLCAYDTEPAPPRDLGAAVTGVADALTHTVLLAGPDRPADERLAALLLFDAADYRDIVHQAAGMVSVRCGCTVDDAIAMLVARSFAADAPIEDIAAQVVHNQTRLC
jgi:hypothetical protein